MQSLIDIAILVLEIVKIVRYSPRYFLFTRRQGPKFFIKISKLLL